MEQVDTLIIELLKKYSKQIDNNDFENIILDTVTVGGAEAINSLRMC